MTARNDIKDMSHIEEELCTSVQSLSEPVKEMNAAAAGEGAKAAPPKFKQKETRQFKSKAPKAGQKG
ncbi:hypothetical protein INR49_019026 [Caranx melampygus]|nr:hypothetical protein INR49_019026 [Caranx melampygus]